MWYPVQSIHTLGGGGSHGPASQTRWGLEEEGARQGRRWARTSPSAPRSSARGTEPTQTRTKPQPRQGSQPVLGSKSAGRGWGRASANTPPRFSPLGVGHASLFSLQSSFRSAVIQCVCGLVCLSVDANTPTVLPPREAELGRPCCCHGPFSQGEMVLRFPSGQLLRVCPHGRAWGQSGGHGAGVLMDSLHAHFALQQKLNDLKVNELKLLCDYYNLPKSGRKNDLMDRLFTVSDRSLRDILLQWLRPLESTASPPHPLPPPECAHECARFANLHALFATKLTVAWVWMIHTLCLHYCSMLCCTGPGAQLDIFGGESPQCLRHACPGQSRAAVTRCSLITLTFPPLPSPHADRSQGGRRMCCVCPTPHISSVMVECSERPSRPGFLFVTAAAAAAALPHVHTTYCFQLEAGALRVHLRMGGCIRRT